MNIRAVNKKTSHADATNAVISFIMKVATKNISKLVNVTNIAIAINVRNHINTQKRLDTVARILFV
jgi:hypothetical protein